MKKEIRRSPLLEGAIEKFKKTSLPLSIIVISGILIFTGIVIYNKTETKGEQLNSVSIISEKETTEEAMGEKIILCETERIMKSYEEIAYEIIRGDHGTGEARKTALTNLGYDESAIVEIQNIVDALLVQEKSNLQTVEEAEETVKQTIPVSEVALTVWNCMKKYGWNDIVCAGIMGNMMAEVGGQTFNLDYNSSGGCGYGLCQWTSGRRNLLLNMYGSCPTIEQQVEFMYKELVGEGIPRQVSEEVYQALLNATSPEECALIFARKFERCGAAFNARQKNARAAFDNFS